MFKFLGVSLALCIVIAGMFFTATASAHRTSVYLTPFDAEELVVASRWAERHNVTDAFCEGRERPRMKNGEATYKHFKCEMEQTVESYGVDLSCYITARIHVIDEKNYKLTNYDEIGCPK